MWKKIKSIKYRVAFNKAEVKQLRNTVIVKNVLLPKELRELAHSMVAPKIEEKEAKYTKIRNVCGVTGRGRAVNSKFGVSRIVFKQLAERGELPGYRKV